MAVVTSVPVSDVMSNQRMEAEYYNPDVLKYLRKKVKWAKIGTILDFVQYGTSLPLNEEGVGHKIFRLNEIHDCFLTEPEKCVVLPEGQYETLRLKKDDVLYCRTNGNVNYVGRTGILKEDVNAVFASYLVRVRPNRSLVLPEYLAIYLNTRIGRSLIARQAMHSNQFNLSAEQMKRMYIPLLSIGFQKEIKRYVDEAAKLINSAKSLISKAKHILLVELGIESFVPQFKVAYSTRLSRTLTFRRVDAEYFQPAYKEISETVADCARGYDYLLNVVEDVKSDFDPTKRPGDVFNYVELADIDSSAGVIGKSEEILGEEAPSRARRLLQKDEVIVSRVEGSLKKVALVDEDNEGSLASTGFFQFRMKNIDAPLFLILAQSIILQAQLKRECAGTILTAVPSEALRRIIVPRVSEGIETKISKLVRKSHESRRKAKKLLRDAGMKVEHEIMKS